MFFWLVITVAVVVRYDPFINGISRGTNQDQAQKEHNSPVPPHINALTSHWIPWEQIVDGADRYHMPSGKIT